MDTQIHYRAFLMKDYHALAHIVSTTWQYEKYYGITTARRLSRAYLALCLAEQTYTQVALDGDTPVGIIMANNLNKKRFPLKFHIKSLQYIFSLLLTREGRRALSFYKSVDKTDRYLLDGCQNKYGGEVCFFVIHPDYRGYGIGKMLFSKVQAYMQQEDIDAFYLFTDTTCNYGFYEQQGMKRCGAKKEPFLFEKKMMEFTLFIYEYINKESIK